ncbi:hypothetical protein JCM21900_005724 [Sporobolomyces salmonicolor]
MSLSFAPSVCGSLSSSQSSTASSLYSKCTYSTALSSPDLEPVPVQLARPAPLLDATTKASLIHLPLHLPAPPEPFPDVAGDLILDDELEGAPLGFVVGKLRSLGPSLLRATTATCLHIPAGPSLPQYLRCSLPPLTNCTSAYFPSHVLAIRSSDSPRTLLLPVHGLLWAASSTPLSILSSQPEKRPAHSSLPNVARPPVSAADEANRTTHLPVIDLNLPSSSAFPFLQGWIYLRSPSIILSALLPPLPLPAPSPSRAPPSLSRLLNPEPVSAPPQPETPGAMTVALSALSSRILLKHVHLVHGLWSNTVALQISDDELWKTMGLAWRILVAALALRERERRRRTTTPTLGAEA